MFPLRMLRRSAKFARCVVAESSAFRSRLSRTNPIFCLVCRPYCVRSFPHDEFKAGQMSSGWDASNFEQNNFQNNTSNSTSTTTETGKSRDNGQLLRFLDQFARVDCTENDEGRGLEFFVQWWGEFYGQMLGSSPRQISLVAGALGLINWKSEEEMRRKNLLTRSQIQCLETQFLLGDVDTLDPRFYATLYLGLQRLHEFDNYCESTYPSAQLVSKTVEYFSANAVEMGEKFFSPLTQITWSLSQMKSCPNEKEFPRLTSLLCSAIRANASRLQPYMKNADQSTAAERSGGKKLPINDFMQICIQQAQTAGAFLEWYADPDSILSDSASEKDSTFWRDWFYVTQSVVQLYLSDSIDWKGQQAALSFDVHTLLAVLCYECLESASEFDCLSDLFAVEPAMTTLLVKCLTKDGATFASDIVLSLERAIDRFSTKCKANAVVMGIEREKIPSCPVFRSNSVASKIADLAQEIREKVAVETAKAFESETLTTPNTLTRFFLPFGTSLDNLLDVLRQRWDFHDYIFATSSEQGSVDVNESAAEQSPVDQSMQFVKGNEATPIERCENNDLFVDWVRADEGGSPTEKRGTSSATGPSDSTLAVDENFKNALMAMNSKRPKSKK